MAWATIALSVASAVMQASATAAAGRAEEQAALGRQQALEHQAEQARINAGQEKAFAQREAFEERRKGKLIASRALAVGAASGAGVGSMERIFGDIGAEEEYRAAFALFEGDVAARDLNLQADLLRFEGDQEARAGRIRKKLAKRQAFGQLFTGFGRAASYFNTPDTTLSRGGGSTLSRKYG